MRDFYVYILECSDETYYTGHTDNIEARIGAHEQGLIPSCYTFTRRPVKVIYVTTFASRGEAIDAEQQVKGWSRRKKEALINGEFELLKSLSKKNFNKYC
jgi:putative endonuclease